MERFNKGLVVYNHDLISNFTEILNDSLVLFKEFSKKKGIELNGTVENDIFTKADPVAINRIVNNLIENAIKFSNDNCMIEIALQSQNEKSLFPLKTVVLASLLKCIKKYLSHIIKYPRKNEARRAWG